MQLLWLYFPSLEKGCALDAETWMIKNDSIQKGSSMTQEMSRDMHSKSGEK